MVGATWEEKVFSVGRTFFVPPPPRGSPPKKTIPPGNNPPPPWLTATPGPECKYRKIFQAAKKLRLDVLMVQTTHVNELVDWQVRYAQQGAACYGFSLIWLHART